MKKLNLKKIKFKELFVQHVEKIVLSAAGVLLLLFGISALGRETLPDQMAPEKLIDATNRAKAHVEQGTFDPKQVRPPDAPLYHERATRPPVLFANYPIPIPVNGPITDSHPPREQPALYSVTSVQVHSGFAPFALLPPENVGGPRPPRRLGQRMGEEGAEPARVVDRPDMAGVRVPRDAKLVVKYWAMVTALVPFRKQKEEYHKTFEQTMNYNPEEDLPNYRGFQIERAEVTSGDLSKLAWKPIDQKKAMLFSDEWAVDVPEPVAAEYVTPFVQPLGPRVGSNWEKYVGHEPEIPFELKVGANGLGGRGFGPMGPGGGEFMGRPGAIGRAVRPGDEEEEDEDAEWGKNGNRKRIRTEVEDPLEQAKKREIVALLGEKQIKGIDHALFRFCDFTVQPGKQYVYRVQLRLRNPNYGMAVKFLKKPEMKDQSTIVSDWSEASQVVTIPHGDKLLAGPVAPPTVMKEPVGKIRIIQVSEKVGAELPLETETSRGTLANFSAREVEYIDPSDNTLKKTTADFVTDSVVLDMRGGKPLSSKEKTVTEPGELLILDRNGRLTAMNEFEDEDIWKDYIAPDDTAKTGPGMMPNPYQMPSEDSILTSPPRPGKKPIVPKSGPEARPQPKPAKPQKPPRTALR